MNALLETLSEIGLTDEEAKVYLACLSVGTNPASTIARSCDLKRETCNYTLKKLTKKGIVSILVRDGAAFYTVEPPERLVQIAESRLANITKILPSLQHMMNSKVGNQAKVKMYQGKTGIETVMEDVLKIPGETLTYTNLGAMLALFGNKVTEFREKRKLATIKSRTISTYSPEAKTYVTGGTLFE
jgi:sugar-specific transcriptional regulator TrmB